MTEGSIPMLLVRYALPILLGLIFQQLYNVVDAWVVGKYVGKEALAAVGSTSNIVFTLVGLFAGLAQGATVVISQCFGAHDEAALRRAVGTTVTLGLILSVAITALGMATVSPMLRFMNTPDDVFDAAKEYLTINFAGVSGVLMYNMGSGILRAVGDSRRPLYFLIFSALLNVGLDLLFVLGFKWGVAGAAYATIVSQIISALLVLALLLHENSAYRLDIAAMGFDLPILKRSLAIGLPSALQQTVVSLSNVFVQSYINAYGSACMAGWSCYGKIDAFVFLLPQGISMATLTFVAQNYGARDLKRARQGVRIAIYISLAAVAATSLLVYFLRRPLTGIFTDDLEVLEYGARFLAITLPFYVCFCFTFNLSSALRATDSSLVPMAATVFSFVLLRQAWLYINKRLAGGIVMMTLSYPAGWVACALLLIIAYRFSKLVRGLPASMGGAELRIKEERL